MELIIQLILGAVGGNISGAIFKNFSLSTLANSVAGMIGAFVGGTVLSASLEGGTLNSLVSGGVGGILAMIAVGTTQKIFSR